MSKQEQAISSLCPTILRIRYKRTSMRPIKVKLASIINGNYNIVKHRNRYWDREKVKERLSGEMHTSISKEDFLYLLHLLQYYKVEPTHDRKYAKN